MILTIRHSTVYRYDQPLRSMVQSLRMIPSDFDGQRRIGWAVSVSGGVRGACFRDGAGDRVEGWTVRGPVAEVEILAEGTVETTDTAGLLTGHHEAVVPETYLRETVATHADAGLVSLADAAVRGARDRLDRAHRLAAAVSAAIAYRPGATEAHTTAAEALALGEGVCQDHAHALIAAARRAGFPARYVSGYLHADADGELHEAAHAWAELWVEGLGWVGFDPANRCCPDERHVRLGSGYDARDAAPVRGVALGAGRESLDVAVAVRSAQQ